MHIEGTIEFFLKYRNNHGVIFLLKHLTKKLKEKHILLSSSSCSAAFYSNDFSDVNS